MHMPAVYTHCTVSDVLVCSSIDSTEQKQIYEETARTIVDSVLKGYNGTIFACAFSHFGHCTDAVIDID